MKVASFHNNGIVPVAVLTIVFFLASSVLSGRAEDTGSPIQAGTTLVDDEPVEDKSELRVAFRKGFNTKDCYQGQPISATLKEDWKMGGFVIAPKGSTVLGHINKSLPPGKMDKLMKKAPVMLSFTKIVTPSREQINIVAAPRQQHCGFTNNREFREVVVGSRGELLNAASLHMLTNQDFELPGIPKRFFQFKGMTAVNIIEGDEIALEFNLSSNNPSLSHIRKNNPQ
ncbi:MAG: hypothetical protein K2W95_33905 [Candidatus Obscuribacterales bacterium]|nr:hypothetical protein [Candidatus Obscuribacterales bacterium]